MCKAALALLLLDFIAILHTVESVREFPTGVRLHLLQHQPGGKVSLRCDNIITPVVIQQLDIPYVELIPTCSFLSASLTTPSFLLRIISMLLTPRPSEDAQSKVKPCQKLSSTERNLILCEDVPCTFGSYSKHCESGKGLTR